MSGFQSVNEGTSNKGKLQERAIQCIIKYPLNQTLKTYAEHLSWDLQVSTRTALESYILPMVRKGYFTHVTGDIYTQASIGQSENNVASVPALGNKCKNCSKPIPDRTTFCSKECTDQYKKKEEKEKQ